MWPILRKAIQKHPGLQTRNSAQALTWLVEDPRRVLLTTFPVFSNVFTLPSLPLGPKGAVL